MRKYVRNVVVLLVATAVVVLTGCQKPFDATGYTQAVLDLITRGETEAYEGFADTSEEEARQQYEAVISSYMQEFDSLGFSDELTEKFRSYIPDLMKKTKYTIQEAKEQEDSGVKTYSNIPVVSFLYILGMAVPVFQV